MGLRTVNEALFEETTIERFERLGYTHERGPVLREDAAFPEPEVVHRPTLRAFLQRQYPHLDDLALETAMPAATSPEGVSLLQRNRAFHTLLTRGFEVKYKSAKAFRRAGITAAGACDVASVRPGAVARYRRRWQRGARRRLARPR